MVSTIEKIRIGVLGCSDVARRRFLPALGKTAAAELAAVASRDAARVRECLGGENLRVMSYDELLEADDVDLVYLSLPNHLHESWTLRALERGKHVICEKPLGLSYDAVRRMTACAEQHGLLLYENMMFLHHPQHAALRNIVATGQIGRVRLLRASFGFPFDRKDSFRMRPEQGGGAFHDLLRYPLATALYFLEGDITQANGYSLCRNGLVVAMHGHAMTRNHQVLDFSVSFEQQYECFYEIVGEAGTIRLDRAYTPDPEWENSARVAIGREYFTIALPAADQFSRMIDAVCGTIASGRDFHEHYRAARRLALTADQVQAGCRTLHRVE